MILRHVKNLEVGMKIRKPLPDDDVPEIVTIGSVEPGPFGRVAVKFWITDEKSEGVNLFPDDLVQIVI
jgi:hypothetical protein